MTYKVHLDGYDLGPALRGEAEWPRKEFIYWTDDGSVAALRYDNWKITFLEQKAHGLRVWQEPFDDAARAGAHNLRIDPFERAEHETHGLRKMVRRAHVRHRSGRCVRRRSGCRASGSSRRARSPAASISTA